MVKSGDGFVYVATGLKFIEEAATSVTFLRKFHSQPICLITDKIYKEVPKFWDEIVLLENPDFNLRDKTWLNLAPYEKCLFLDTDTYVTEDISELFLLLEEFDLAAHQLFEGHEYDMEGVPHAFPEFNTGVIAYLNTPAFETFCLEWRNSYDDYANQTANDQRSFRKTLYHSRIRHTVLTPEYNYRPLNTNFAIQRLKIIHGRSFIFLEHLERKMNRDTVHRAYVPRLDAVVSDFMNLNELWILWCGTIKLLFKEVVRKLIPLSSRNKLRKLKRRIF